MDEQLTEHFKRSEFACKCGCGLKSINTDTVALLEKVRQHFNSAVNVHCGCRCKAHNAVVGGELNSMHLPTSCRAVDFDVEGHSPNEVADFVETLLPNTGGIGRYDSFTHMDNRPVKARWDLRK
jgi:uncharacterized protein YcbK (DUF882 family)